MDSTHSKIWFSFVPSSFFLFFLPWYRATVNCMGKDNKCQTGNMTQRLKEVVQLTYLTQATYFYNSSEYLWLGFPVWAGTLPQTFCPAIDATACSFQCSDPPEWQFSLEGQRRCLSKKNSSMTFFTWVRYINKIILIIHMIVKVTCCIEPTASDVIPTVILDTLGKPSLQTLVHGLQAGRDGLLSELPRLWSYQLLKSWKHFGKVSAGPNKSRRQRAGSCGTTGTIVADREAQRSILASWGIQGPMLRGNSDAKLISTERASFKYEYILLLAKLKQWSLCCFQDLHLSENRNGK